MTTNLRVLSDYIRDEIGYNGDLGPDVDLLDEQILDSFSIVQVAIFIQDHFQSYGLTASPLLFLGRHTPAELVRLDGKVLLGRRARTILDFN